MCLSAKEMVEKEEEEEGSLEWLLKATPGVLWPPWRRATLSQDERTLLE